MDGTDVIVIGAGIAGASAAYELAEQGRVVVLERESFPGYHSTGRSAAVYHETYGKLLSRRLATASRSFFVSPPAGFTEVPLVTRRGLLKVARRDQLDRLEESRRSADAGPGPALQVLDGPEAVDLVPVLRLERVARALYEPEACDLDVDALHQGFLRGLKRRGGRLVVDAEVGALRRRGGAWEVDTSAGQFAAPTVINAAGAWADQLAKLAGLPGVGLVPRRRTALVIDPPDDLDIVGWPMVIDVDEAFYFKPDAGRILVSPADETPRPPCDVQPDELDVAIAIDRLEAATTLRVRRVIRRWAGLRNFVSDRLPVVGFDPRTEGFFWLAGQGGTGIMTSPAAGRLVAGLVTRGALPTDIASLGVTVEELAPARLLTGYS